MCGKMKRKGGGRGDMMGITGICGFQRKNRRATTPHPAATARFRDNTMSPDHGHTSRPGNIAGREPVDIDAARYGIAAAVAAAPYGRINTRFSVTVRQTCDLTAEYVVYPEIDIARFKQFVAYRCRRVERIRRVRGEGEDLLSLRAGVFDGQPGVN